MSFERRRIHHPCEVTKMVEAEGARRRAGEQPRGGGGGHEATCTVRHCCSCVYVK